MRAKDSLPLRATLSDGGRGDGIEEDHTSLQQRRSGTNKLSLDVTKAQSRLRSKSMNTPTVCLTRQPTVHAGSNSGAEGDMGALFSTAHLPSSTLTASRAHANPASTPVDLDLTPALNNHDDASAESFVMSSEINIPASAVRDLVSVFVPRQEEYSTVTDNIDVSCFRSLSPPRSPVPTSAVTSSTSPHLMHRKRTESVSAKVGQLYLHYLTFI